MKSRKSLIIPLIIVVVLLLLVVATVIVGNRVASRFVAQALGGEAQKVVVAIHKGAIMVEGLAYDNGTLTAQNIIVKTKVPRLISAALSKTPTPVTLHIDGALLSYTDNRFKINLKELTADISVRVNKLQLESMVIEKVDAQLIAPELLLPEALTLNAQEVILNLTAKATLATFQKELPEMFEDLDKLGVQVVALSGKPEFELGMLTSIAPWVVDASNWRAEQLNFNLIKAKGGFSLKELLIKAPLMNASGELAFLEERLAINLNIENLSPQMRSEMALFFMFLGLEIPPGDFGFTLNWYKEGFPEIYFN